MSGSPGDADDDDRAGDAALDVLVSTCGGDAALLVRDRLRVDAVPMLADLDVLELAGDDTMLPSTSSSPGRASPKLRARRAAGADPRAEVSSIHRVALKESRNRTFLIASRRLPRIDDRFFFLAASSSSSVAGRTTTGTAMEL
ncbi:unnamed protein product [Urochloa humidicola]